jgi:hypothetical protein
MILCRQATELLTDDMEGRLRGFRKFQYRLHLAICGRCQAYRQQMHTTVETLHQLPKEPVPDETKSRALEAFRTRKASG